MILKIFGLIGLLILGLAVWIRLSPVSVDRFHQDPETAERPSVPGHVLMRAGGDMEPASFEMDRATLADRLEAVILDTPRTVKLAGDLQSGFASYVTRSALIGFPDIASVKVISADDGTSQIIILSRLRFGQRDFGVNRAKLEDWISRL